MGENDKKVQALLVRYGQPPRPVMVGNYKDICQKLEIERMSVAYEGHFASCPTAAIYADDDGKIGLNSLRPNRAIYDTRGEYMPEFCSKSIAGPPLVDVIYGDFLIVNCDPETGEDISLTDGQCAAIAKELTDPISGEVEACGLMVALDPERQVAGLEPQGEYEIEFVEGKKPQLISNLDAEKPEKSYALFDNYGIDVLRQMGKLKDEQVMPGKRVAITRSMFDFLARVSSVQAKALRESFRLFGMQGVPFAYKDRFLIPVADFLTREAKQAAISDSLSVARSRDDEFNLAEFYQAAGPDNRADIYYDANEMGLLVPSDEGLMRPDNTLSMTIQNRMLDQYGFQQSNEYLGRAEDLLEETIGPLDGPSQNPDRLRESIDPKRLAHLSNVAIGNLYGAGAAGYRFDYVVDVNAFEELMRLAPEVIVDTAKERGDFFTSDRECVAFMVALAQSGVKVVDDLDWDGDLLLATYEETMAKAGIDYAMADENKEPDMAKEANELTGANEDRTQVSEQGDHNQTLSEQIKELKELSAQDADVADNRGSHSHDRSDDVSMDI